MTVKPESNAKYVSGALIIHALIAGVFIAASLYSPRIVIPQLGIKGALVDSSSLNPPKKPESKPEPDVAEQQKQEEQKKQEQLEQERQKEKEQEKEKEKEKEEQLRAEQQEKEKQAQQQRIAEAQQEAKRQKVEAEKKRVEEIRQKQLDLENKQKQAADNKAQAAREAELKAQLADEEGRNRAVNAGLLNQYAALIRQRVERNWIKPPSAQSGIKCEVRVTQAMGGMVLSVSFGHCNADAAVRQSIDNAVMRSSPLPPPSDPRLFDRNLSFIFNPAE